MNSFIILVTLASFGASTYAQPNLEKNEASTMIVGGSAARQGQFPYQLEIKQDSKHWCGASLVQVAGIQVAITAAHCVNDNYPEDYTLVAGELVLSQISGLEQYINVSKIVSYPNYSPWVRQNDISIMFFNESFELNENVRLVSLPEKFEEVTIGTNITVSGWGDLAYSGDSPDILQYVEIPTVSYAQCNASWSQQSAFQIVESQLCAGESTGTVSSCHGDSGGPAVSESGFLAGIVSWGQDCGHKDFPGVFTKVSHFIDWIEATVRTYQEKIDKL